MGGTLLLADDSITIQKVVELTFADTDHRVVAVGSGRELLRRMSEVNPDVVLCDVVMPDMNGYDVCQSLKSDPATLHIPVVLLTGTFEPFDRDRALAVGSDSIVTKPFEARELIATVDELMRRSQAMRTAAPPEHTALGDFGIGEGVPSLDFTTTGFDKMVPAPPAPELPPEHGMELTSSGLGRSYVTPVPPPPAELSGPSLPPPAEPSFAFAPPAEVERVPIEGPWSQVAVEGEAELEEETFPSARATEIVDVEAPPEQATAASTPFGELETPTPEFGGDDVPTARIPIPDEAILAARVKSAHEEDLASAFPFAAAEPLVTATEPEALVAAPPNPEPPLPMASPSAAALAIIEAAAASAEARPEAVAPVTVVQPYELTEEDVERVAQRALALLPIVEPLPAPAQAAAVPAELTPAQVDEIARRVMELARPVIEQIAWEVIPDMGEMVIRARIRELEGAAEQEN